MKKTFFISALLLALAACQTPAPDNSQQAPATQVTENTSPTPPPAAPATDTLCFETKSGKDVFSLQLIINGNSVSGNLDYKYYQKDGAYGTLSGTIENNLIVADYAYTIEGSEQTEVVEFKLENGKISRKRGELAEKDGKLVLKDPAKAPYNEIFTQINCAAFEHN
ncbi:hypothetical protein C7N43_19470 [Sphingobacteriales bacterium UPWRP_1]|nr:hypothetical protein B6N25_01965 [Sphingobacteriales bacterium TSM_CSS]PSJ75323.1 hypothetical protein C7N43_19470 [Sphingobacteriales bacterium UPWRP_1]